MVYGQITTRCLHVQVMLGLLGARILGAIAGNRAIDDTRIYLVDRIVVNTQLLGYTRAEALNDNVGFLGHLLKPINNFFVLEIQRNRLLITTKCGDVVGNAAALGGIVVTHEVAKTSIFNLDYRCTKVSENLGCITAWQVTGEVENGKSRKWSVCT